LSNKAFLNGCIERNQELSYTKKVILGTMKQEKIKTELLMKEFVTHDVKRFVLEKPKGYEFTPGQATEVAIDKDGWREEKRPFTFTSLNEDKILEFTIKEYPEHKGVTEQIHQAEPGQNFILEKPWGTINYEGEGVFLAGGAGITPFIAILRQLKKKDEIGDNKLIFSNKTHKDIILEKEFKEMFAERPENLILTLTHETFDSYESIRIDKDFLQEKINDFSQNFYICGPPGFVKDMKKHLKSLGAVPDSVVFEE